MRLFWLLLSLITTSCFSLGIPEVYLQEVNRPEIAIDESIAVASVSELAFAAAGSGEEQNYLGSQYILGFIPFTRLYFQHSVAAQVVESYLKKDFTSITVSPDALKQFPVSIEFLPLELTVNAYDFLFFRRLSVHGDLKANLRLAYSDSEAVIPLQALVSSKKFVKSAHLPKISLNVEEALLEAVEQVSKHAAGKIDRREVKKWLELNPIEDSVTYLLRPVLELSDESIEQLRGSISSSYGPGSEVLYPKLDISRLLQRGIETSFSGNGLEFFSSVGAVNHSNRLEVQVEDMLVDSEVLNLKAVLNLFKGGRLVKSARLEVLTPLAKDSDAQWFLSIQQAGKLLADKFLKDGKH